jgi:hypothetical protein
VGADLLVCPADSGQTGRSAPTHKGALGKDALWRLRREASRFAGFADPHGLLDAEWRAVEAVAEAVRQAGWPALAHLLALRPPQGMPMPAVAVRYFFRREVETDPRLFQGLAFAQMERLGQNQEAGYAALGAALARQAGRLDERSGSQAGKPDLRA